MPRSRVIAFLRAINVGGHNVKMDRLKELFEALGLGSVETFIASGNVIFTMGQEDRGTLERRIEEHLHGALGYPVATFIRTLEEVAEIVCFRPFDSATMESAVALSVGFLKAPLDAQSQRRLGELETDIDRLVSHGRELYWWCALKQSQSTFSNAVLERALGVTSTWRGLKTVLRLAEAYPAAS